MHYDVAILGGGFVGHVLRHACVKLGLSVCVVESKPPVMSSSSDGRAIALAYTSVEWLKKLGVWPALESHASAIQSVQVSAQGRLGTLLCTASSLGIDYLGQVVPAPLLGSGLMQGLSDELIVDTVTGLTRDTDHATVQLQQKTITASLVLACDGTDSFCRDHLQIKTQITPSSKKAWVMNVMLNQPHQQRAFQRLIKDGVCALLPLQGNKATAVLSLEEESADDIKQWDDQALFAYLKKIWGGRFGDMMIEGPRFVYPLKQVYVEQPISDRVILMGNAAHTLNPIAAQGLNLALRDSEVLYDILKDAIVLKKDLGEYVPAMYLSRIQPLHQRMQQVTDGLVNLSYTPFLSPFQGIGLSLLNHLPFVKEQCAKVFAGLA